LEIKGMTKKRSTVLASALLVLVFNTSLYSDAVTDWNTAMLTAIRMMNTPPPAAARNLAILHVSIYDAVNGISRTYENYSVAENVPASTSIDAAAAAAAHEVLVTLYSNFRPQWDAMYDDALQLIQDGPQKRSGISWGSRWHRRSCNRVITMDRQRSSCSPAGRTRRVAPDDIIWRDIRPALLPQWGSVTPFGIGNPAPFLSPAPPSLVSAQYAADFNQTKAFGSATSTTDCRADSDCAFGGYGPGTTTPAGHWNQIAQEVAFRQRNTLEENARLFALLNIALADAAICQLGLQIYLQFLETDYGHPRSRHHSVQSEDHHLSSGKAQGAV
jgi:hypothetical protein